MQYMLLIHSNEADEPKPGTDEGNAHFQAYMKFTNDLKENGVLVAGEALESVTTATTVRVRNGKTETTDGPFAETKEQLGGYYLLDCKDLDEAVECASRIPSAQFGSIEIRPVVVFE